MSLDVISIIAKDPHLLAMLQGSGAVLALAVIRAASKDFDMQHRIDPYRPYLEKGLLALTVLVGVLKFALEGNAAGAPWDQIVNGALFFFGGKATGTEITKKLVMMTRQRLV
jgi:hypothetical protein